MTDKPRAPALATRCRRCRKPIVWPGLCYTCATGLPRQILRADERLRVADLADQCFPLDDDVESSSLVS
jgi:hypothetical protein